MLHCRNQRNMKNNFRYHFVVVVSLWVPFDDNYSKADENSGDHLILIPFCLYNYVIHALYKPFAFPYAMNH